MMEKVKVFICQDVWLSGRYGILVCSRDIMCIETFGDRRSFSGHLVPLMDERFEAIKG